MSDAQRKTVGEVFADFNIDSNILKAAIENIKLYKKTNKIELDIFSEENINIKELALLEKYLEKRFDIKDIVIDIKYLNTIEDEYIIKQWSNVINYMAQKYPLTRALLKNSKIDIVDNKITVNLSMKGQEVLQARGFEKILSETILNIFDKKYKVSYKDNTSEEYIKLYKEQAKHAEKLAVELAQSEIMATLEEPKEVKQDNTQKIVETKKEEVKEEKNSPVEEEQSPLILGRNINIKDGLVKVEDISIDSGKISLEGEIVNTDSRELKSGKFLIMFDLYDGISTITCKSFVEADKAKTVMARIAGAKGVKIAGTAQFDPFAKELGVIANVIIETPGKKKQERKDISEEKRVELHMHTQMSQMDGMSACKDLIKRAMKWGMKSIAITDHGVVQAFPDAHKLLGYDNKDMKVIYGVEAYLVPDKTPCVSFPKKQDIDTTYCVLDLETTGLSFRTEKITEVRNNEN